MMIQDLHKKPFFIQRKERLSYKKTFCFCRFARYHTLITSCVINTSKNKKLLKNRVLITIFNLFNIKSED